MRIETLGHILNVKSKSVAKNKLPVIFYTAYSNYQENFMTWSADAYLVKSSDLTPLVDKIKEILDGAQQPVPERAAVTAGSTY